MTASPTMLRLVATSATTPARREADADAFDLGPARRALVGAIAVLMVALAAAGWAHTDTRTAMQVRHAEMVRAV